MNSVSVRARLGISLVFCCSYSLAQAAFDKKPGEPPATVLGLKIVKNVETNEFAGNTVGLPSCDDDGNVYISSGYEPDAVISKYNEKGERTALF